MDLGIEGILLTFGVSCEQSLGGLVLVTSPNRQFFVKRETVLQKAAPDALERSPSSHQPKERTNLFDE